MKKLNLILSLLVFLFLLSDNTLAQYLRNPSLEGTDGTDGQPDEWQSSPLHVGSDPNFYSSFIPFGTDQEYTPVDGETFTLYRARGRTYSELHHDPETREYSFQQLIRPLEANSCFKFEVYLAFNPHHQVMDSIPELVNKSFPLKFQVWGGNGPYTRDIIFVDSDPIINEDWEKHTFYFSTDDIDYSWILFEVQWDTINIRSEPYNAYLLIDNLNLQLVGTVDTTSVDTVYYRGDNLTTLTANHAHSYTWEPSDYVFPNNTSSIIMNEYYPTIIASIQYDDFVCSKETFEIILDCDTLYPNYTHRSTDYYYKYDTLLELRAMDGTEYFWEPQTNLTAYDIQTPLMTDYQEHYLVTVTDKYNCIFHEEFHIILNCDTLYPGGSLVVIDTLLEDESSIVLDPLHGEVVSNWYPPIYLDCVNCQSPTANPRSYVSYSVELKDEFDCIHQEIFTFDIAIKVPNVITPNDDGYNDCWKISGIPMDSELFVFEKNGTLRFSQKPFNSDYCWEGTDSDGNPLKAGNYWYAIEHPFFGTMKTGFILIKR